jgi:formylglycine-generating enzyme required for sulfatase activity
LVEVAVSEAIYGGIIPATYGRFGGLYANPELIAAGHVMISVPAGGGLPAFFIDTFEVSNAQMLTYISGLGPEFDPAWIARGAGPLDQNRAGDWALRDSQAVFWPVHGVSGLAARAYCANIGAALPTWEQWSRAAFWAGDDLPPRPYPWGEAVPDRSLAHFNAEGPLPRQSLEGGRSWAGAYHLAGNVAEWVTLADGSLAVVGGSFLQDAVGLQASLAEPQAQDPGQAIRGVGFRCAQN